MCKYTYVYVHDLLPFFKRTPEFQWCRVYGCLNFSFSFSFFLFSSTSFPLISLPADLWPCPLVCPSLPFWDITLLMLPGENITHSYPGM